ncbi:MAG: hypothetical protein LBQ41_01435 [Candidatus Ancillula sp.]|nr:hypothetical protein [Candidatus Ancillula sp.]
MKVVAEAAVEETLTDSKTKLWERTKEYSGISRGFYRQYFDARKPAYAFKLGEVSVFKEPKTLEEFGIKTPPQSFVYVEKETKNDAR